MKNAFKTVWLIVGVMFVAGAVLALIGIGLGASRRIQWTARGLETGNPEIVYVQKSDTNAPAFRKVDLSLPVTWAQVTVRQSDHYGYDIKLPGTRSHKLGAVVRNGVLFVSPQGTWNEAGFSSGVFDVTKNWAGIDLGFGNRVEAQGKVIIYVPQNVRLDAVDLDLAAGEFDVSGINAKTVRVSCPAGDVTVSDIVADTVNLDVTTGSMRTSGITADSFTATLTAGEMISSETSAATVNLSVTTGQMTYSGDASRSMTLKVTMGEGTVNLRRPRDDYALITRSAAGDLSVNGQSVGLLRESDPNLIPLSVSVITGQISLNFRP